MNLAGDTLPGWPVRLISPSGPGGSQCDLIAVDIDGDGDCEIFTDNGILYPDSLGQDSVWYYGFSWLFGLNHAGQYLPGYPIRVGGAFLGIPPTFALDQRNNRLYMALADFITAGMLDTAKIELFLFPDSTGPPDQWPMLHHDNLHTRNYNFVDRVTSVYDEGAEILPQSPILKQNYPNPYNFSTMLEFTLPREGHIRLSVYDILGRKVVDIYDQVMAAGMHRHRLSMDVPSGIYLYRLETEKTVITRKMVLVK
jgi:hypothetical protein